MLLLVPKTTYMLLWTRSDNHDIIILHIIPTRLYGQILSQTLGVDTYDLVISQNSGMKGIISTACGFTFQYPESLDSWSGLVGR
jgi:hypothetical protein